MTQTHTLTLKLFGALRNYGDGSRLEISVPERLSVKELKERLQDEFRKLYPESDESLRLSDCAFADESRLFGPDEMLEQKTWIAVLPPVCGG